MLWWGLGVLLFFVYWLGPDLWHHGLKLGVIHRGEAPSLRPKVALTFDDGPSSEVTGQVLDVLAAHAIHCTFFPIGENMLKAPEVVARMVADEHEIGSHGLFHRPMSLLGPLATWRQIASGQNVVTEMVKRQPRFYRPPWGQHNLLTHFFARILGMRTVLWSVAVSDWTLKESADQLAKRVVETVRSGDIVLLHDAGGAVGAAARTAAALPMMISGLQARGFDLVPVSELVEPWQGTRYELLYHIWHVWDRLYRLITHVRSTQAHSVFYATKHIYQGISLTYHDGTVLRPGDTAMELHFNNAVLAPLGVEGRGGVRVRRLVFQSLPDLAQQVRQVDHDVTMVYGVTLIHRGAQYFGFDTMALPDGFRSRILTFYLRFILALHHPEGWKRLRRHPTALVPRLVYMSKRELIQRYIQQAPGTTRVGI